MISSALRHLAAVPGGAAVHGELARSLSIILGEDELGRAGSILLDLGFAPDTPAMGGRRRYRGRDSRTGRRWEIELATGHDAWRPGRLRRARWLLRRRRGPVVAFLGPDGAGKGSIVAAMRRELPVAVTAVYLGEGGASAAQYRPDAAEPARHGRRRARRLIEAARARVRRRAHAVLPGSAVVAQYRVRHALHCAARMVPPYARSWCGDVVLCDRHPLEHGALAEPIRGFAGTLERWVFRRLVPWPDLVILLDAPGAVLFDRKGEHSPELLDAWRRRYRAMLEPRGAEIVSTDGPPDEAIETVRALVWRALEERRDW